MILTWIPGLNVLYSVISDLVLLKYAIYFMKLHDICDEYIRPHNNSEKI